MNNKQQINNRKYMFIWELNHKDILKNGIKITKKAGRYLFSLREKAAIHIVNQIYSFSSETQSDYLYRSLWGLLQITETVP